MDRFLEMLFILIIMIFIGIFSLMEFVRKYNYYSSIIYIKLIIFDYDCL